MEALRIKKEEEEQRRQYYKEMEKYMGEVGHQLSAEQPVQTKPDVLAPIFPANNLYPSNQVPSVTHETKAAAKYIYIPLTAFFDPHEADYFLPFQLQRIARI